MSSHNHNNAASPSFVGIVLILTFVITLGIMSFGTFPVPLVEADDDQVVAVAEVATDVPEATATEVPSSPTPVPTETNTSEPTAVPTHTPTAEPTAVPEQSDLEDSSASTAYDVDTIAYGETLYGSCGACHGADALGIPNLGKNLIESEFIHSLTDEELVDFIKTGRPMWDAENTTGIDMPAKGGNPALSDDDIFAIVAYLRTLGSTPEVGEVAEEIQDEEIANESVDVATYDPSLVAQGEALFLACGACHASDGSGIPNLGKSLIESEFVDSLTDEDLVDFIKTGRPMWDADNTTGIDMPAKGGNPALSDEDIYAIVVYIRSLNQ